MSSWVKVPTRERIIFQRKAFASISNTMLPLSSRKKAARSM